MQDPAKGLTPSSRLGYGAHEHRLTPGIKMKPGATTLAKALHLNLILPGRLSEVANLTEGVGWNAEFEFWANTRAETAARSVNDCAAAKVKEKLSLRLDGAHSARSAAGPGNHEPDGPHSMKSIKPTSIHAWQPDPGRRST